MSFVANHIHFIWSTAHRTPSINPDWEPRLYAYIGGILRAEKATLLAAGGMPDHIHILASLPATISLADAAAVMKSNSSHFIHEQLHAPAFDWQKGYAAFSVSVSGLPAVDNYIRTQRQHHQKRDFRAEYLDFLEKHQIPYDPQYVFV